MHLNARFQLDLQSQRFSAPRWLKVEQLGQSCRPVAGCQGNEEALSCRGRWILWFDVTFPEVSGVGCPAAPSLVACKLMQPVA